MYKTFFRDKDNAGNCLAVWSHGCYGCINMMYDASLYYLACVSPSCYRYFRISITTALFIYIHTVAVFHSLGSSAGWFLSRNNNNNYYYYYYYYPRLDYTTTPRTRILPLRDQRASRAGSASRRGLPSPRRPRTRRGRTPEEY
jgi:hypothetical protein